LKNWYLGRRPKMASTVPNASRMKWNSFFPALMAFRVPVMAAPLLCPADALRVQLPVVQAAKPPDMNADALRIGICDFPKADLSGR
jgi:hypothetical protein